MAQDLPQVPQDGGGPAHLHPPMLWPGKRREYLMAQDLPQVLQDGGRPAHLHRCYGQVSREKLL